MKIIIGLGNPGEKYQGTRHNLGFLVLDELAKKLQATPWKSEDKFKSEVTEVLLPEGKGEKIILAKPFTYMNNSGLAVSKLVDYFKLPLADLIVIHDELDLPLGKLKLRLGGSGAGHHGIESIITDLGNDAFTRVRLGIGNLRSESGEKREHLFEADKFVLEPFLAKEKSVAEKMIKNAAQAVKVLIDQGLEKAQNQYH